jgi:ATP-dependent DNA ligase
MGRWWAGAVVFRHACKMGLEGIVSKRLTAPYRSGPSRGWIKMKNPDSPAMRRALRANDGETSESLKFSLEGEGQPS